MMPCCTSFVAADVVLVGAGTIRAEEGYGPDLLPAAEQRRRVATGLPQVPALAVVSGKLDLDLAAPVFEASVILAPERRQGR